MSFGKCMYSTGFRFYMLLYLSSVPFGNQNMKSSIVK